MEHYYYVSNNFLGKLPVLDEKASPITVSQCVVSNSINKDSPISPTDGKNDIKCYTRTM